MKYLTRGTEVDMEKCVANSGGNRYDMVLVASARGREIRRRNAHSSQVKHLHVAVTTLLEIQNKEISSEEYLLQIR
jgi:hypothetical protein